jgi:glycosyltransferase involved in cell wall biosynthesis
VTGLISVILTTYQREDALDAVLRGLARQIDREFEIVVADDGSGPQTRAAIERWLERNASRALITDDLIPDHWRSLRTSQSAAASRNAALTP